MDVFASDMSGATVRMLWDKSFSSLSSVVNTPPKGLLGISRAAAEADDAKDVEVVPVAGTPRVVVEWA